VSGGEGGYTTTTTAITTTYDALNRLTGAEYSDGTFYEYEYDAVGNRAALTTTEGTITYTYDATNRLTNAGGVAYTHDGRGNLTQDGTFTYTYDAAGRLAGAESVTHTIVYTYNGDGVRVAMDVDGVETQFVVDQIGLPQVLVEYASSGTTFYIYGVARLAQVKGDDVEWFLGDALGSVRQLVDGNGEVILARDYSPYGQLLDESGTGSSGYAFAGEQYDATTGLVFLRARWFDVIISRRRSPTTARSRSRPRPFGRESKWGGSCVVGMVRWLLLHAIRCVASRFATRHRFEMPPRAIGKWCSDDSGHPHLDLVRARWTHRAPAVSHLATAPIANSQAVARSQVP
jgi:YD repeat-containing protein